MIAWTLSQFTGSGSLTTQYNLTQFQMCQMFRLYNKLAADRNSLKAYSLSISVPVPAISQLELCLDPENCCCWTNYFLINSVPLDMIDILYCILKIM